MWKLLVGLVTLVAFARPSDACGFWSMHDEEKNVDVGYLINSVKITKGEKEKARTLGAIYFDEDHDAALRTAKDRKIVFDVKNGKLTKYGKVIATIGADHSVAFGKRVYTIELSNPHKWENIISAWSVTVKRGDKVIVTSPDASALCAGLHRDPPWTEDQMEDEVRRRVMYYLAWRETGP